MPKINIVGQNNFTDQEWQEAHYENTNRNMRFDQAARMAQWEESNYEKLRQEKSKAFDAAFAEARWEESNYDKIRQARAKAFDAAYGEAKWEDSSREKVKKAKEKAYDSAYKDARWQDSNYEKIRRHQQKLSQQVQRDQAKTFDSAYSEASYENRRRAAVAKIQAATDPYTYRIENVRRLGMMGERAAEHGNWWTYAKSRAELRRIDRNYGDNAGVAQALKIANMRIAAGGEGQSGLGLGFGEILGGVAGTLLAPEVAIPLAIAYVGGKMLWGAAKAPQWTAQKAQEMVAGASVYNNMRLGLAGYGRSTGLDSRNIEAQFSAMPDWMKAAGLGPQDAAAILQKYGVGVPTLGAGGGEDQAVADVRTIVGQQYLAGIGGLGIDTYTRSASLAKTLGLASGAGGPQGQVPNDAPYNLDTYFRHFQKYMTSAVSQGVDRAHAFSSLEGLYRQALAGGVASLGSGQSLSDMATKLLYSGTPGGRSGYDAQSLLQSSIAFSDQIGAGGQPLQVAMVGSFVQRMGGPKAFADPNDAVLRKMLGEDAYQKLKSTAGGAQLLNDLHQAAANGNPLLLQNALAPIIRGSPQADRYMVEHSYLASIPGYWGTRARQIAMGVDAGADADYRGTRNVDPRDDFGPLLHPGGAGTRGIRNNNPLNLEYRPGQGAIGRDPRFGVYHTMEEGLAADAKQLWIDQDKHGLKTVRELVSYWVSDPKADLGSYIADVARAIGVSPDQPIDIHNQRILESYLGAAAKHESGAVDPATIHRGVAMALGQHVDIPANSPYHTNVDPNDVTGTNAGLSKAQQMSLDWSKDIAGSLFKGLSDKPGDVVVTLSSTVSKMDLAIVNWISGLDRFTSWFDRKALPNPVTTPGPAMPGGTASMRKG